MNFVVAGGEPFWIAHVAGYAFPDLAFREFEHGLVLANPSLHAATFDVQALFPRQSWRRSKGSARQDSTTNNGERVGSSVQLGARDALFLVRVG